MLRQTTFSQAIQFSVTCVGVDLHCPFEISQCEESFSECGWWLVKRVNEPFE